VGSGFLTERHVDRTRFKFDLFRLLARAQMNEMGLLDMQSRLSWSLTDDNYNIIQSLGQITPCSPLLDGRIKYQLGILPESAQTLCARQRLDRPDAAADQARAVVSLSRVVHANRRKRRRGFDAVRGVYVCSRSICCPESVSAAGVDRQDGVRLVRRVWCACHASTCLARCCINLYARECGYFDPQLGLVAG
jgi:hypothetical protein